MDAYGPFDSGAGANITEATWRRFMKRMRGDLTAARSGVIRDAGNTLQVYDDNTGMQVKVKTGEVWIEGHWGEITSDKTIAITAADPTFARKDRIVAAADFVNNSIDVYPLTGIPAASPSVPPLTQDGTKHEISLGIIDIPALDTSISGQTTDARHYLDLPYVSKVTTSDVTVNNSTTLVDVTQLSMPVSSNAVYAITGLLVVQSGTTPDAKIQITGPTGASARLSGSRLSVTTTSTQGDLDAAAIPIASDYLIGGPGVGNTEGAGLNGRVSTSDTAGTLTLKFAQSTADASNTVLVQGSWLELRRVA
jgi:hypothetical protein